MSRSLSVRGCLRPVMDRRRVLVNLGTRSPNVPFCLVTEPDGRRYEMAAQPPELV